MKRLLMVLFIGFSLMTLGLSQPCEGLVPDRDSPTDLEVGVALEQALPYTQGQMINISIRLNKPAFVAVIGCTPDGQAVLLFPERTTQDMTLAAGERTLFLSTVGYSSFPSHGTNTLQVLVSTQKISLFDDFLNEARRSRDRHYLFTKPLTEWLLESRMNQSSEWSALQIPVEMGVAQTRLKITSQPQGSSVMLNGERVGTTPWEADQSPGKYRLRLEQEGFRAHEEDIFLNPNQPLELHYPLTADRGSRAIVIDSFPQGAEVWIDGRKVGTTPYRANQAFGSYVVSIQRERYKSFATVMEVVPGDIPLTIDTQLIQIHTPANYKATLALTLQPEQAQVKLNGILYRERTLTLQPGAYVLEVSLSGYQPLRQLLNLEEQQALSLNINLVRPMGVLKVHVDNTTASVFANGILLGQTPLQVELEGGRYQITLVAPHYRTHVQDITIKAGETFTLSRSMGQ